MSIPTVAPYELPEPGSWPEPRVRWQLDRSRAALLVHDMQAYFMRVYQRDRAPMNRVVEHVEALHRACVRANVPVFFSVQPGEQSDEERGLLLDMWGPGIVQHPSLAVLGIDVGEVPPSAMIRKRRYSAFYETELHERMREAGRDQLIVTGIYAHIGCLATAVDGFMRGIQPFFVADATADFSRTDHDVALRQVSRVAGVVVTTQQVLGALGAD